MSCRKTGVSSKSCSDRSDIVEEKPLVFKSGILEEKELSSALDQIGHLTGILGQMLRPETMEKPLRLVEAVYDKKSDRWHEFKGFTSTSRDESYVFDESVFRWIRLKSREK